MSTHTYTCLWCTTTGSCYFYLGKFPFGIGWSDYYYKPKICDFTLSLSGAYFNQSASEGPWIQWIVMCKTFFSFLFFLQSASSVWASLVAWEDQLVRPWPFGSYRTLEVFCRGNVGLFICPIGICMIFMSRTVCDLVPALAMSQVNPQENCRKL